MEIRDADQLEKAKLEDTLMDLLYGRYKDMVFHGGTAIWRCYSGNRFSRDLDMYLKATRDRKSHYEEMSDFLKECGFAMKEKGYERSTDTMHFLVESNVKMKIDINFRYKKGVPAEYTRVDDSKIVILALTPEGLLDEKIEAYSNKLYGGRKYSEPEVQDLYDMYYLTTIVRSGDESTAKRLRKLLDDIEAKPPGNARSLDHLILRGVPPDFGFMVKKLREWSNANK